MAVSLHRNARFISALCSLLLGAGCSGLQNSTSNLGTHYVYTYSMVQPEQNTTLKFQDSYLELQFGFDGSALTFQLLNNSDQQISIVWDRVSIGIKKKVYAIRNYTTFYTMGNTLPQSLVVPPKGILQETVIPWQNVYYEKGRWIEKDLFPTADSGLQRIKGMIESSVGSEIELVLPVRVGRIVMDYTFSFKVTGATPLAPGSSPPAKERPPMPDLPIFESSIMQGYLPIVISAGIFLVAIYFFSQKKAPAAEL